MGALGFPNPDEISSMMGFVTEEDRDKWDKMKKRSDEELAKRGEAGSKLTAPVVNMAERTVHAQMQGEMISAREAQRQERQVTKRTVTTFEETEHLDKSDDDYQMG